MMLRNKPTTITMSSIRELAHTTDRVSTRLRITLAHTESNTRTTFILFYSCLGDYACVTDYACV